MLLFSRVDTPTEKRVRKWEISLEDLVVDPLGKSNNRQYLKQSLQFGICVERRFGHCRFEGYMGVKKSRQKQLGKMEAGCQCHGFFSGIISQSPSPFVRIYGQKKLDLFLSLRDSSVQPCSGGTTNFWQKNVKRYRGHSTVYATFLATFYQI